MTKSARDQTSMSFKALVRGAWGVAIVIACGAVSVSGETTAQDLMTWGLDAYSKTTASFKVAGSSLFAETASLNGEQSGGSGGFAYIWPLSTQFRVQSALTRYDRARYGPQLRQISDEARERYWHSSGGYRSGVGLDATLFYDDNAHMAVALLEAHRITSDPVYLARARETYQFVLSGEDAAGGGGVYFSLPDRTVKETISTLQASRAAVMLYRATGEHVYLADAKRLYEWAKTHVQQPDGLFLERYYLTGEKAGTAGDHTLVNATGVAILLHLEFYAATGELANLREAQRIAARSLALHCHSPTGAIYDEGYWAHELVDALCELTRTDGNPNWRNQAVRALHWLHDNRRDPNGRYGPLWGRGGLQREELSIWHLNDNAAVARSFLQAALAAPLSGLEPVMHSETEEGEMR